MKIGYAFWGFLADERWRDGKRFSAPDGNATYSWAIISALIAAGHEVVRVMPNRDEEFVGKQLTQDEAFKSFAKWSRWAAYRDIQPFRKDLGYDDVDAFLLEWRMPIPGRNVEARDELIDPDWYIQQSILERYRGKVPIIALDLDYAMSPLDDARADWVFELGWKRGPHHHIEIPFDFREIDEFTDSHDAAPRKLVYVGNRYGRDEMIERYLAPIQHDIDIVCYGNWLEGGRDSTTRWPGIGFGWRLSASEFHDAYRDSVISPVFLKPEYNKHGFMTARIWESLFFGTLPVVPTEFTMWQRYVPSQLTFSTHEQLLGLFRYFRSHMLSRDQAMDKLKSSLVFMDAKHFADDIIETIGVIKDATQRADIQESLHAIDRELARRREGVAEGRPDEGAPARSADPGEPKSSPDVPPEAEV